MNLNNARGAALFSKMFEKAKNPEHDPLPASLTALIHYSLKRAKKVDEKK